MERYSAIIHGLDHFITETEKMLLPQRGSSCSSYSNLLAMYDTQHLGEAGSASIAATVVDSYDYLRSNIRYLGKVLAALCEADS